MDRKALTEILAKDKTSAGMAAPNRFALPPVRQRSARNDHQRRRRVDKVAPPESRGGQGQYHRDKRPGADGEGLSAARHNRRSDGDRCEIPRMDREEFSVSRHSGTRRERASHSRQQYDPAWWRLVPY